MRKARIKGVERSYYHCVSRIVHRQFLMGAAEKEYFRRLMRRVEGFCDVRILAYAIMDNHFHILLEVPESEPEIDDEELFRRMEFLYGGGRISELAGEIGRRREAGRDDLADSLKREYLYRMRDVSEFMKTLKQRFTQWYNHCSGLSGTLWESRFKSVLIENSENALSTISAYIDLNPVRAGIVRDPKDYRFCSYAEAVAGGRRARESLLRIVRPDGPPAHPERELAVYRQHLYISDKERSISRESIRAVIEAGGELPVRDLLACRIRYFTDGIVLGSRQFVEDVYRANRGQFGVGRKSGAHRLRHGEWGGLCALRDLRRDPVTIPL